MDNKLPTISGLHEFFLENLEMLASVIRHGYPSLSIPPLDPLKIDSDLKTNIDLEKAKLTLKMGKPTLTGLSTLGENCGFEIDLTNRLVSITLNFSKLQLTSQDFQLDGEYKLLLFNHNLKSDGSFNMLASDIELKMTLSFNIVNEDVIIESRSPSCEIGDLDFTLEDSFVLSKVLPLLKTLFENVIAEHVATAVAGFIDARLQQVYDEQKVALAKLHKLYKMKQQQTKTQSEPIDKPRLLVGFDGVGELPLPMFWQIPSVDIETVPTVDLNTLAEQAKTGDLILFAGSADSSLRIRRFTQSRFSHVVVVIKEPDIQGGRACVWQATSSSHHGVLRNMEFKSGIQLNYLEDMLRDYRNEDANSVICHRALIHTETTKDLVKENWRVTREFIQSLDGKPYTNDMDGLYIMGLMEIDNPDKEDYFCAGLVAEALMRLQLLSTDFRQYQYAPRDFSELQTMLPISHPPMHYAEETMVTGI